MTREGRRAVLSAKDRLLSPPQGGGLGGREQAGGRGDARHLGSAEVERLQAGTCPTHAVSGVQTDPY